MEDRGDVEGISGHQSLAMERPRKKVKRIRKTRWSDDM